MTNYEMNKRWRHNHPDRRAADRKKYYSKSVDVLNSKAPLTLSEIEMILAHEIPDSELSKKIGRSVEAIQVARCKHKKSPQKLLDRRAYLANR